MSHVLNAAAQTRGAAAPSRCHVATSAGYYGELGVRFLGVTAVDIRTFDMSVHFETAADFIDSALQDGGGVAWGD